MYQIFFNKTDTLADTLLSGATSTTLTNGIFGSPTGAQLLVVDWDVPASAEIILATISGISLTGITRGLSGGAASTTDHQINAKVASITVPQMFGNGLGAIAANDEWEDFTSSVEGYSTMSASSVVVDYARFFQLGKLVFYTLHASLTTAGTATPFLSFALPVLPKSTATASVIASGAGNDGSNTISVEAYYDNVTGKMLVGKYSGANWPLTSISFGISGIYEAA